MIAVLFFGLVFLSTKIASATITTANQDQNGNWYFDYVEGSEVDDKNFTLDKYYQNADTSSKDNLTSTLRTIVKTGHVSTGYGGAQTALYTVDEYPAGGGVMCLYLGTVVSSWNREHVWPQSKFEGSSEEGTAKADLVHLHATDSGANSWRGNLDFGYAKGNSGTQEYNNSGNYRFNGYFEPRDAVKGDIARSVLYMVIRYQDLTLVDGKTGTNSKSLGSLSTLLKWHVEDPVDDLERRRNDRVYNAQGNRNPFIDHPEYANTIWGTNYVLGDGYKVEYSVPNGVDFEYKDTKYYNENDLVREPSLTPYKYGYTFEGWYTDSNYQNKWNFSQNKISTDLKLYAHMVKITDYKELFKTTTLEVRMRFNYQSTGVIEASSDEELDFTKQGYSNSNDIQAYSGSNFNFSPDKGTNGNPPRFYESGNAARFYGGNTFTISSDDEIKKITITLTSYNGTGRNGLTAAVGSYEVSSDSSTVDGALVETGIWTGSATSVKFTVNGTSGHQRIQKIVVSFGGGEVGYQFKDGRLEYRYKLTSELKELLSGKNVQYGFKVDGETYIGQKDGDYVVLSIIVDDIKKKYEVKGLLIVNDEVVTDKSYDYSLNNLGLTYIAAHKNEAGVKEYLTILRKVFS